MDYKTIKEETTNFVEISGIIENVPVFSHEIEGEKFFEFQIEVDRLSHSKDSVPITISERAFYGQELKAGDFVKILGEYRSFNKAEGPRSRLMLYVFAKEIEIWEEKTFVNEVKLSGFLCKEPIYRKTPFGREICDVLLAVNRTNYHKSDYVPCILWGRNARFMANQSIGCKIEIVGRIQSRNYTKTHEDGTIEQKVAYEISCQRMGILSNATLVSMKQNENSDADAINN